MRLTFVDPFHRARIFRHYRRKFGRDPSLKQARGFNDLMINRILYDRDRRLKTVSDKIAVKSFVTKLAGADAAVPLLGAWARAEDIDWDSLPARFVLKPNQTSGPFEIVGPEAPDRARLTEIAARWIWTGGRYVVGREWGYRGIPVRVMAEPLIVGADGAPAPEADVFVFSGRAALIRIMVGQKLTKERRDTWFDRDGNRLDIRTEKIAGAPFALAASDRARLIEMSEAVSQNFSFMRVDFFLSDQGLKIGELTPYSWGGLNVWAEERFDTMMGSLWTPPADTSIFDIIEPVAT